MKHQSGFQVFSEAASPQRIERFRARHRIGEQVSGTLLAWQSPGLGWVDFQGTTVLARMNSLPEIGSRQHFLIKQLTPDIILQELSFSTAPDISSLLQRLWAEQNRLDAALSSLGQSTSIDFTPAIMSRSELSTTGSTDSLADRLEDCLVRWRQALEQHGTLHAVYQHLRTVLEPINDALSSRGLGRFFPLPWLANRIQGAGLLLRATTYRPEPMDTATGIPGTQAVFTGTHPALGYMEIQMTLPPYQAGWTLHLAPKANTPKAIASVTSWLQAAFPQPESGMLSFHGVQPLPSGEHSGVLARLLLSSAQPRPRLHIQV